MKRLLILLVLVFSISGCDDGDLTVETINFDDVVVSRCGTLLHKIAANETLIIEIGAANAIDAALLNDETPDGEPRILQINGSNRVIYRSYNSDISPQTICGTIAPAEPVVVEEWMATSGTIEITTNAIVTNNAEFPGGQIITGYRHSIVFRNINFSKPNGDQLYETFVFGDYTPAGFTPLPFNFTGTLEKCTGSNLIFDYVGTQAFTLNIDPTLIINAATPDGAPRTGLIGSTANVLQYIKFDSGPLTPEYFCTDPIPSTPVVSEVWTGVDGIDDVSGIIEVTTTFDGTSYMHEIHLKNVTLKKGNSSFLLAIDYLYGQLITN